MVNQPTPPPPHGASGAQIAALLPHRGSSSYSGSKAALEMITDTLRLELAPWEAVLMGIEVVEIWPSRVALQKLMDFSLTEMEGDMDGYGDTMDVQLTSTHRLQISVSIIEPGYVQTPLAAKQLGDNAPWRQADAQKRRLGPAAVVDPG